MSWREDIVGEFPSGVHRLTLAADPDGLLTEESYGIRLYTSEYEREAKFGEFGGI